jgi:ABC-type glutathione transport system ATPase component
MGDVQLDPRHHQGEYGGDGDFNQAVPDPWDGAAPAGPRRMGAALAINEQRGSLRSDQAVLVEGLTKRFESVMALDGIDFWVPAGTVFGLLGPNGAGKTTAIRILTTILRPDGGHAEVLGIDVARDPAAVRYRIGLAGQYAAVDPNLTGQENLRLIGRLAQMANREVRARSAELLERFDLAEAADRPARTYSAGCADAWTWPPPWSSARRCCSWTSPPPGWTCRAAASCGR